MVPSPTLERCVGDADAFAEKHWGRAPLHRPLADAAGFADLLSVGDIDAIVSSSLPRLPTFRLVRDGQALPASAYAHDVRIGGSAATGAADPVRVWGEVDAGATLALQALHRTWPPLASFCRALEVELTHPVQANAYLTPPAARGLGVHHDTHDVLVLQLEGTKRWEVYEPVVESPLPSQRWSSEEPVTPLALGTTLAPGDVLYLPRGTPHVAWTEEGLSAHLTIGILTYTAADVLRALLVEAEEVEALRASLPPGFARSGDVAAPDGAGVSGWAAGPLTELAALIASIDPAVVERRVARRFWSGRHAVVPGQLAQVRRAAALTDDDRVRRRPGAPCWVECREGHDGADELVLELGEHALHLPGELEDAVRRLADGHEHRVGDLGDLMDASSRLVLVRRLVREGLLEVLP